MAVRFGLLASILAGCLVLAAATPAAAQTLLDDLLPQSSRGVCTCAKMEPPNDCSAILAEPRRVATQQRREIRGQCAMDWRTACEDKYGWQTCAGADAQRQLASECDGIAEQWWTQVAAPQLADMQNQCDTANSGWIDHCETVERPASCETCQTEEDGIAELETQIRDTRAWLTSRRNGEEVLTAGDEELISERLDQVERWERELSEKREGYAMLQDTDFCPRPD